MPRRLQLEEPGCPLGDGNTTPWTHHPLCDTKERDKETGMNQGESSRLLSLFPVRAGGKGELDKE